MKVKVHGSDSLANAIRRRLLLERDVVVDSPSDAELIISSEESKDLQDREIRSKLALGGSWLSPTAIEAMDYVVVPGPVERVFVQFWNRKTQWVDQILEVFMLSFLFLLKKNI